MNTQEDENRNVLLMPIRDVVKHTGIQAVTLRAWERRYGLLKPQRSSKGHRLYSQGDINRIETIMKWINRGVTVSQVTHLVDNEKPDTTPKVLNESDLPSYWQNITHTCMQAVIQFDSKKLKHIYNDVNALYPLALIHEKLLMPLHDQLHQRWRSTAGSPTLSANLERNFFFSALKQVLHAQLELYDRPPYTKKVLIIQYETTASLLPELVALICYQKQINNCYLHYNEHDILTNFSALSMISEETQADALIITSDKKLPLKALDKLSKHPKNSMPHIILLQCVPLDERSKQSITSNISCYTSLRSIEQTIGNGEITSLSNSVRD